MTRADREIIDASWWTWRLPILAAAGYRLSGVPEAVRRPVIDALKWRGVELVLT